MGRKRHTAEQIIRKLREVEVELGRGLKTLEVCRKLGITEQTYYRWRKEYGGLGLDQAKRLKELEKENSRLLRPPQGMLDTWRSRTAPTAGSSISGQASTTRCSSSV